ncbi:MAG: DUF1553 domain-containing protein [Planctomycetes bacterium]|nr:DUF1553 domain-containing protein [Planctomycetota bacterium]
MTGHWSRLCCSGVVAAASALAQAPVPVAELHVYPPQVRLDDARDQQRLTAVLVSPEGVSSERTGSVEWRMQESDLAEVCSDGEVVTLRGRRPGSGTLLAVLPGIEVRVPVQVEHADLVPPISFRNEVVPILTRSGCNAGSCHGAAVGKEGFGLSLFGYHPERDHLALTRELRSRRIHPEAPEQSLLLLKATAAVPHKGNQRFTVDSPRYRDLRDWIAAGAPDDGKVAPALVGIELLPAAAVLVGPGQPLHLQVRARYADGSDRDVTELALWSSSNELSAAVSATGRVESQQAGEACVLARFAGCAAAAEVMVLADRAPAPWPAVAAANFVDEHVHQKLQRARVAPAPVCSDEVFVRRVFLDLVQQLPTPAEAAAFVADPAADKRARLVDDLLQRPGFATAQAMAWAEVLQADAATMELKGANALVRWLEEGFATNRPFDAMVHELLTASGATFRHGPANLYVTADRPHLLGERVAQNFLGVRMQCAQCHNHPFENWTMNDYYGFAAFFAQVGRKRGEDPYEFVVWDRRSGEARHERDNSVAAPRFLGGGPATVPPGTDRRRVLADWLCAADNPWLARNVANRVWAALLGRGIVDPPDDVRISNPASHPALLEALAKHLVDSRFDVRTLFRTICTSRTYQLARHPDEPPAALFAGNQVRRLTAEQLLDAIGSVTGVPTKYTGVPLGGPATAIARGRTGVRFLEVFGRPPREGACTCERRQEPTLSQALHLINGDTLSKKIADRGGRLRRALEAEAAPAAMLEELFLAAYSRRPTAAENEQLLATIAGAADARAAWEDVYWAVLNSKEFCFQH